MLLTTRISIGFVVVVILGCYAQTSAPIGDEQGSLIGHVTAYLDRNNSTPADSSIINLDAGSLLTMTDRNGAWSFYNVPVGTHIVSVYKKGFSADTTYNVQVAPQGFNVAPELAVYALPEERILIDSLETTDSLLWEIFARRDTVESVNLYFVIDSANEVAPSERHLIILNNSFDRADTLLWAQDYNVLPMLRALHIAQGTMLYLSAFAMNDARSYNPINDETYATGYGAKSNVITFRMP